MANVILFRPREKYSSNLSTHRPPVGLICLGTALKSKGFSVKLIDCETSKDWHMELENAVDKDTILAGVGVMTGYQIKGALDFSRAIKQIRHVPVVWGGLHSSLLPDQTIQHELVDIVVIGEGEDKLVCLAEKISKDASLEAIPNIFFKKNGEIIKTSDKKQFLDMDTLIQHDYDLIDTEYYASFDCRYYKDKPTRCLDINTDRGCPHRCGFCYNIAFNQRRWRSMRAQKVVDLVDYFVKKYNLNGIIFLSDNFFVDKERVKLICEGLINLNLNIKWESDIRIDTFLKYDDDLINLMRRSGCNRLTFGLESGSDRVLKLIHKDVPLNDVFKAHARAEKLGIEVNYHFMFGFPEETKEEIIETANVIYELTKSPNVHTVWGPSIYVPYPGTPLFERCVEMGFNPPSSLEGWVMFDWENESVLPWFNKAYKRYMQEVQFICRHASGQPKNAMRWAAKKYFRLRLLGLSYGINLGGLDIHMGLGIYNTFWSLKAFLEKIVYQIKNSYLKRQ